jgi:hypothetical protein
MSSFVQGPRPHNTGLVALRDSCKLLRGSQSQAVKPSPALRTLHTIRHTCIRPTYRHLWYDYTVACVHAAHIHVPSNDVGVIHRGPDRTTSPTETPSSCFMDDGVMEQTDTNCCSTQFNQRRQEDEQSWPHQSPAPALHKHTPPQ